MSVTLEQDGLYILPNALEETYVIVQAERAAEGWQLTESHATDLGSEEFKARAQLPPDQQIRYAVDSSGALTRQGADGTARQTSLTLANLSLIGYLRGGRFIPTEEGL
jgi:hypothetical protein